MTEVYMELQGPHGKTIIGVKSETESISTMVEGLINGAANASSLMEAMNKK